MRTGVSYLAPHDPRHIRTDLREIRGLDCDDVLLAFQENDVVYFPGKLAFLPEIARDEGLRPIAVFWGGLNLFGGGRSSQFLLEHPEAHQVRRNGGWDPGGCYNNAICIARILEIVDLVAALGFEGFFVDEPSPSECYCASCRALYASWYGTQLERAAPEQGFEFRRRSVIRYIRTVTDHIETRAPRLETMCCIMPSDRRCWPEVAAIPTLDCLGTDLYWANESRPLEEMLAPVRELAALCRAHGKIHQEWFQCWGIESGNEERAAEQGRILASEEPDALYTWAYNAQLGTSEACARPYVAWSHTARVLRAAKRR